MAISIAYLPRSPVEAETPEITACILRIQLPVDPTLISALQCISPDDTHNDNVIWLVRAFDRAIKNGGGFPRYVERVDDADVRILLLDVPFYLSSFDSARIGKADWQDNPALSIETHRAEDPSLRLLTNPWLVGAIGVKESSIHGVIIAVNSPFQRLSDLRRYAEGEWVVTEYRSWIDRFVPPSRDAIDRIRRDCEDRKAHSRKSTACKPNPLSWMSRHYEAEKTIAKLAQSSPFLENSIELDAGLDRCIRLSSPLFVEIYARAFSNLLLKGVAAAPAGDELAVDLRQFSQKHDELNCFPR